jgi:glucose/mannose-6-phosphate isomerase
VVASHSGNTEETLAAYAQALARRCRVVSVSAGGELAARSQDDGVPHVRVARDDILPRAALGYLAGISIGILDAMRMIPPAKEDIGRTVGILDELAGTLGPGRPAEENEAKAIAEWLAGRTPVIWGSEGVAEVAALRWKTQMNENAKLPAFHASLPELDHNEVEGWSRGTGESFALVVLRHGAEHPRTGRRVEASLEAISQSGLPVREVAVSEASQMGALFSLILAGDFVSTYLALLCGVDPTPIPVLSSLKDRLLG